MEPEEQSDEQKRLSFDEKPIGGGTKMPELEEYPPDFNPNQIQIENKPEPLPIAKRIQSKVWKIRKEALEQLYEQCKQDANKFQQYQSSIFKLMTDSNHQCQERALKILHHCYEQSEKDILGSTEPKTIIKTLIQKCLVADKGQIVPLATQILFWMMDHYRQILLLQLNEELLNKNPKIVACTLIFMEKLVNNYGMKKLANLEVFQKSFIIMSDSVRPIAKKQSASLFKQIYKWMGETTLTQFRMHPQVKDEVSKFGKTYVKEPMPIKRGLDQLQKKGKKSCIENAQQQQNNDPQDVLGPYDSRWVDKTLEIEKWKEKKAVLDEFIKKTNFNNLVPRQCSQFITLIKRLMTENNINLLQCGFKIVKNLCKGLRKNFAQPCKSFQSLVFVKLKDTKMMIVDEAQQTLLKMLNSITVEDLLEDIKQGLKDKAPNMRLQILKLLEKILLNSKASDKKLTNCLKVLTTTFVNMHQDGSSEVRQKSIDILCKIKGKFGMNFFGDKLKKLPAKKLQTIQNYINPDQTNYGEMDIEQEQESVINNIASINLSVKPTRPGSMKATQNYPIQENSSKNNLGNKQSKFTIASQPIQKQIQTELQSPIQSIRYNWYQQLMQKSPNQIYSELIQGYKNKMPMYRESSTNMLKTIVNLVKKSSSSMKSNGVIGIEQLEVITYHDWKKNKNILMDFIQNSKLSLSALQYVKNNGILSSSGPNKREIAPQANNGSNFKFLCTTIQNILSKMSSPQFSHRLDAANKILTALKEVPVGTSEGQQISEVMNQFYNVLKCRIQDNPYNSIVLESVNKYIDIVTELLNKGIISSKLLTASNSKNIARQIILILISKIDDTKILSLEKFIKELVGNHPTLFFQLLPNQIIKDSLCDPILSIIRCYNESFFKFADHKVYILPLLTCISMGLEANKCMELLDQLVELNGQNILEKVAKQAKLPNVQEYLKKWGITVPMCKIRPYSQNTSSIQSLPPKVNPTAHLFIQPNAIDYQLSQNKFDRLNAQLESPWPLTPSPSHILKLMNTFLSMGDKFQVLASPIGLTSNQIQIIYSLENGQLQNYSDLFVKWIFWRINIEYQPNNIQAILGLCRRILTLSVELHQSEFIILMSSLEICLRLYNMLYLSQIEDINKLMSRSRNYKEKAFHFWINVLVNDQSSDQGKTSSAPINQILLVIQNCFEDMIVNQMVTLARLPCILKNAEFIKYLKSKFSQKLLTVYGFKFNNEAFSPNSPPKIVYSKQTIPDSFINTEQSKYYLEFFRRSSSNEVVQKIIEHTEIIPENNLMETHMKIMWSIIPPYLEKELPFINVYNYFRYLQKIIMSAHVGPSLLGLVKILCYFLIDVDEMRSQSRSQMLKTINKLILMLLEIRDTKHIIEVLFLFYREQILAGIYTKLNLLLPKCMGKVLKSNTFKLQIEHRNPEYIDILRYAVDQITNIFTEFKVSFDNPIMKTMKGLLNDMLNLYGNYVGDRMAEYIESQRISETVKTVMIDLFNQKTKQNTGNNHKNIGTDCGMENKMHIENNIESKCVTPRGNKYEFNSDAKSVAHIIRAVGAATQIAENCMNEYTGRKSMKNNENQMQ